MLLNLRANIVLHCIYNKQSLGNGFGFRLAVTG